MDIEVLRFHLPKFETFDRTPISWDPLKEARGWKALSFVRYQPTWIKGELYSSLDHHPLLASYLLFLKSPDWTQTIAVYPISTLSVNHDLIVGNQDGRPTVSSNIRRVVPGQDEEVNVICGIATGRQQERQLVRAIVNKARNLVGSNPKVNKGLTFWDGIGICTWESLRQGDSDFAKCTKDNLLALVPSYPITHFLIDDGWQDIRSHTLKHGLSSKGMLHSFSCSSEMGSSMKELIGAIKAKAKPISGDIKVGVWVTLEGYWYSLNPESPHWKKYNLEKHATAKGGQPRGGVKQKLGIEEGEYQWLPNIDKAGEFWLDWLKEMKSWGIDFIKCDNQAHGDVCVSDTYDQTLQAMWSGMLDGVQKVWGSTDRVIMCMSHNERMLNGPGGLDFDRPAGNLVFRNSDDYNLPRSDRHTSFIHWNMYNSILTSHLSLIPDFDMFASNPPDHLPIYHAFFRCLTPGPFLLSDAATVKTDQSLLSKMTSRDKKGKLCSVKTENAIQVVPRRWFWDNLQGEGGGDGPGLLGYVKMEQAQGALMGMWNLQGDKGNGTVNDNITKEDVEDALELENLNGDYLLYSTSLTFEGWTVFHPEREEEFGVKLDRDQVERFVIAKLFEIGELKVACLGLLDKFAPLAGVIVEEKDGSMEIKVEYETEKLTFFVLTEEEPLARMTVDGRDVESTAVKAPSNDSGKKGWLINVPIQGQDGGTDEHWHVKLQS